MTFDQRLSHNVLDRSWTLFWRAWILVARNWVISLGLFVEISAGLIHVCACVRIAALLWEEQLASQIGDYPFEVFYLLPQARILLFFYFVLLFELVIFGLVQVFPVALWQRVYWLISSPVCLSLKRIPFQCNLSQLPVLHLKFLTELSHLLFVVIDFVHELSFLKFILIQGPCKFVNFSIPLSQDFIHVMVFFFEFVNELGESFDFLLLSFELFCEFFVHNGKGGGLFSFLFVLFEFLGFFIFKVFESLAHSLIFSLNFFVAH